MGRMGTFTSLAGRRMKYISGRWRESVEILPDVYFPTIWYPLVSSNMACWKIPEPNGGLVRNITYFYGPWPPANLLSRKMLDDLQLLHLHQCPASGVVFHTGALHQGRVEDPFASQTASDFTISMAMKPCPMRHQFLRTGDPTVLRLKPYQNPNFWLHP